MDKLNRHDLKITHLLFFLCITLLLRNSAQGTGPRVTQKAYKPLTSQDFPYIGEKDNYFACFWERVKQLLILFKKHQNYLIFIHPVSPTVVWGFFPH